MDEVGEADRWWHDLPPQRRVQLWKWVEQPTGAPEVPQGQAALAAPGMPRPPRHARAGRGLST